ncbi:MAG TPA: hypothetical protein VII61_09790 [Ktedonobacteraceae bacterium]
MIPLKSFLEQKGFAPVSIALPPVVNTDPFVPVVLEIVDEEYEAWKREMGLDVPLTDQQVIEIARYELQEC